MSACVLRPGRLLANGQAQAYLVFMGFCGMAYHQSSQLISLTTPILHRLPKRATLREFGVGKKAFMRLCFEAMVLGYRLDSLSSLMCSRSLIAARQARLHWKYLR